MNVLLFLNDDYIVLAEQARRLGQKTQLTAFDWDDLATLQSHLSGLPRTAILGVLLDYIDEDIRSQWFPKLLPWERPALEKRQVQKVYSDGAAFVNFLWKNNYRKNDKGRDEQEARISSVDKTELLTKIFHIFNKQHLTVKSVYSTTFLLEGFYATTLRKALKISSKQVKQSTLLLFRESQYVFRQVLLCENAVKLTRLIEIDSDLQNELAIMVGLTNETALIVRYIYSQKLLEYNAPIGVVYLDNDLESRESFIELYKEKVVQGVWDLTNLVFKSLPYQALLTSGAAKDGDSLFIKVLSDFVFKQKPAGFYQNALTKKINQLLVVRSLLIVGALLVVTLGAYYNARLLIDTSVLNESNKILSFRSLQYQQEIKKIELSLSVKFDAEDIKQVVDFSEKIVKPKIDNRLGFDLIGFSEQVLGLHPQVQLTQLEWKQVGAYDAQSIEVFLTADLGPRQGNYKPYWDAFNAFVQDVKSFSNVKNVVLLKTPLDLDLSKSMSLNFNEPIQSIPVSLSFEVDYAQLP